MSSVSIRGLCAGLSLAVVMVSACHEGESNAPTAAFVSVSRGDLEGLVALLDSGADPSESRPSGYTLLHVAVQQGHAEIVRLLVERGAAIDETTVDGASPLHLAVRRRDDALVGFLLERGANSNQLIEPAKVSALQLAAQTFQLGVVRLLLDAGADPNAVDVYGVTALHYAARTASSGGDGSEMVELLIASGADANVRNQLGENPLHRATRAGSEAALKRLVEAGADPTAADENGDTPLAIARERSLDEIIAIYEAAPSSSGS